MPIADGIGSKEREFFQDCISSKWKKWKDDRADKESVWDECFDAFISEFPANSETLEYRSQRYYPVVFEAVMNVLSQMQRGAFPNDAFATAMGDNADAEKWARIRSIYMQNRLEACGFVEEFTSSHILQLLVFGNAPYELGWDSRRSRSRQTFEDERGQTHYGIRYRVGDEQKTHSISPYVYDGPSFKSLDIYNFVRDPFADDTSEGEIKIYRSIIGKAELLRLAKMENSPYDLAQVKKAISEKTDAPREKSDSDAHSRRQRFGITGTEKPSEDSVEVLFSHGDYADGTDLYQDYVTAVVNRKHVIRCEPNPFEFGMSPLRLSTLIPVKGMPYGLGIVENALGINEIIQVRQNQVIDCLSLTINPILKINSNDGEIDPDNLISEPGAQWWMEDTGNVEPLFLPNQAFQGYNEVAVHEAKLTDATFSHKNFGAQTRQQTATEVATSASMMATVLGRFIQRMENKDIEPILVWFDEVEKQFYDPEGDNPFARYQERGENQFEAVTPEIIYQSYTWKAQGSGFTHLREIRLQQLFQWGIAAAQTPAAQDIDWREVFLAALQDMGRRDAEKLIPGLQRMMERAKETGEVPAQILAQLQAQSGGNGGGLAAPGSNNPEGLAPSGRGAIPQAGAAQTAGAGQGFTPLE